MPTPTIHLIAGCNGAGKTTFAKEFLPKEVKCLRFLNADEIARGLSPFKPSTSAVRAARLLLQEIHDDIRRQQTFALETTLSGKTYIRLFRRARQLGYEIELHYLWLSSPAQAIARVRQRVQLGGHHVPAAVLNAASFICSTTISHWPVAGRFGTMANCPQNGSPFPPRMISNLCDN
jgi:predicted ABC-type ATPase